MSRSCIIGLTLSFLLIILSGLGWAYMVQGEHSPGSKTEESTLLSRPSS
ncbi:MAG: hypothetical protein M0Z65_15550 [Firmicutes bacterium]|uniref:Uncharacterized protein n=1 Tax=Melghirimyces thermohalophilus TaxID=1236220 RepID=A0A1G6MQ99_9BACL|nr:hypothetical protein [Melghirimyces thermohalophilus]MDA8354566.1 hypothetical protein [Bacillota bacterium]SDC57414.1 hypothetical protein SAMN04488112_11095 [Melghirimyces thermohalophilus]